jgi:hypothetical protein
LRTDPANPRELANALAVSQASVAGTSAVASASITVASDGSLTGATSGTSLGTCTLSGSVTLAEPDTAKNLFLSSVVASGGSACKLEQGSPYKGFSASCSALPATAWLKATTDTSVSMAGPRSIPRCQAI